MRVKVYRRWMVVAITAFAMAGAAHAGAIAIFDTGVSASGNPLPNGTAGDLHYTLVNEPGGTSALQVRTSAGGYPIPPWLGSDAFSAWIGPQNDAQLDGPAGNYDYRTTFNLTGFAFGTASLSGQWSADNEGVDILINGISTGNQLLDPSAVGVPFESVRAFSINSGFIAGVNTLDFIVRNFDTAPVANPTGLRVEISGTVSLTPGAVSLTPEPASLALFGPGFAALYLLRRRLGWAGKLR